MTTFVEATLVTFFEHEGTNLWCNDKGILDVRFCKTRNIRLGGNTG